MQRETISAGTLKKKIFRIGRSGPEIPLPVSYNKQLRAVFASLLPLRRNSSIGEGGAASCTTPDLGKHLISRASSRFARLVSFPEDLHSYW